MKSLATRLDAIDWQSARDSLGDEGYAVLPPLLDARERAALIRLYDSAAFRSTVDMARHSFGRGEYRYFDYPLPLPVEQLRQRLYPPLAGIANDWASRLGRADRWPDTLADFLARCRRAGQTRATPLLLRYGVGDYNCLHQDLYGNERFPLQAIALLSEPGVDFDGGELVLVENRPRRQSRPMVVPIEAGGIAIVPVAARPEAGPRGDRRVTMRHGVARIRRGQRTTLGVIFHDAC
jgi:hypothetical protein